MSVRVHPSPIFCVALYLYVRVTVGICSVILSFVENVLSYVFAVYRFSYKLYYYENRVVSVRDKISETDLSMFVLTRCVFTPNSPSSLYWPEERRHMEENTHELGYTICTACMLQAHVIVLFLPRRFHWDAL